MKDLLLIALILIGVFVGAFLLQPNTVEDMNDISSTQRSNLPKLSRAPELDGIAGWINTDPLTLAKLRGKVVLVDFWTYSCINCQRTFPHLRQWHETYSDFGFVLLGVHTPEFDFEKNIDNVRREAEENKLAHPIALDNDYKTWRAFANRYWPAHYLIDAEGTIRYTHFGEGRYEETEAAIQELLIEAGLLPLDEVLEITTPPAGVDFDKIGTPELYLGHHRIAALGNPGPGLVADQPYAFTAPDTVERNRFYLGGTWTIKAEHAVFEGPENGTISIRYKANKANMVLSSRDGNPLTVEVLLDGKPLTEENRGTHVELRNGKSYLTVSASDLYNITNTGNVYDEHILEIIIPDAGFQAFTYTFG